MRSTVTVALAALALLGAREVAAQTTIGRLAIVCTGEAGYQAHNWWIDDYSQIEWSWLRCGDEPKEINLDVRLYNEPLGRSTLGGSGSTSRSTASGYRARVRARGGCSATPATGTVAGTTGRRGTIESARPSTSTATTRPRRHGASPSDHGRRFRRPTRKASSARRCATRCPTSARTESGSSCAPSATCTARRPCAG